MWLKFIKFNYLLPKMCSVIRLRNSRSCSLFGRILSFSLTMSKLQVLWKFLSQNSFTANFFIAKQPHIDDTTPCNQAKYPQDAPQQKLSILLLKPRHSTICHHISSFSKISIKSSKKCGLLATLVKFNQASNSHLPHQWKFVKNKRSIYIV